MYLKCNPWVYKNVFVFGSFALERKRSLKVSLFYSSVPLALLLTSSIAIFVLLAISPAMLPAPPAFAIATDKVDVFVDGFCLCQKKNKSRSGFL